MYTMHSTQLYLYAMIIWRKKRMMTNTINWIFLFVVDNNNKKRKTLLKTRFLPSDICMLLEKYILYVVFRSSREFCCDAKNHRLSFDFLYCTGAVGESFGNIFSFTSTRRTLTPPARASQYNNSRFIHPQYDHFAQSGGRETR